MGREEEVSGDGVRTEKESKGRRRLRNEDRGMRNTTRAFGVSLNVGR